MPENLWTWKTFRRTLAATVMTSLSSIAAADKFDDFHAAVFRSEDGGRLPYRLLVPAAAGAPSASPDTPAKKFPLLVFLHGAGERGDDNAKQLTWGADFLRTVAKEHGAFILVPQCPAGQRWMEHSWDKTEINLPAAPSEPMALLLELIASLRAEHPIDGDRLYAMGLSMGGMGTWDLVQRNPQMFAAAVVICGGGDVSRADRIKDLPLWVFHGEKDTVVPVQASRKMVARLKELGSPVKYTEYPGVGHNSWSGAFEEDGLAKWLFSRGK